MAKHNDVCLYGFIPKAPVIAINEAGELQYGICSVVTIRGIRDFGKNQKNIRLDAIRVMTYKEDLINIMSKLEPYDMVEIKGSLTTKDVTKTVTCPGCGHRTSNPGMGTFVNPIYFAKREHALDENEAILLLKQKYEISNSVTLIGMICREPSLWVTSSGAKMLTYQICVLRKYKMRDDSPDNTVDFPWVKVYNRMAISDKQALRKGAYVFIDGVIQVRNIERTTVCTHCGQSIIWNENVEEVVPTATEYLRDHYTIKEIREMTPEEKQATIVPARIDNENDISKPLDAPDFDVNGFISSVLGENINSEN